MHQVHSILVRLCENIPGVPCSRQTDLLRLDAAQNGGLTALSRPVIATPILFASPRWNFIIAAFNQED